MEISVPALEMSGWETDPQTMGIKLFSYALQSEEWQSSIYEGKITSLQGLVIDHQNDPDVLASAMERSLETYYKKHFDSVSVTVSTPTDDTSGRYTLDIDLTFSKNNVTYSLGKILFVNSADGSGNRTIREANT